MNRLALISLTVLALLCASCHNGRKKDAKGLAGFKVTVTDTRSFPEVSIPAIMEGADERINYMVDHLWDDYLDTAGHWRSDSTYIYGVEKTEVEEKVGLYTTLLNAGSIRAAQNSTSALYDRMAFCQQHDSSANIFPMLSDMISRYLYDPNSPVRSEDIYLPFVRKLSTSCFVSEGLQMAYAFDAQMCALNAVGTKATDFFFKDIDGRVYSLYGVKAPYTLLFFSNPGCPSCKSIIDKLMSDEKVGYMLRGELLAIVNIYIDEDLDAWREYLPVYPAEWLNGYDHNYIIRTDRLYSVRAIPSLYILGEDKTVIMKDAPEEAVMEWIHNVEI